MTSERIFILASLESLLSCCLPCTASFEQFILQPARPAHQGAASSRHKNPAGTRPALRRYRGSLIVERVIVLPARHPAPPARLPRFRLPVIIEIEIRRLRTHVILLG